MKYLPLPPDTAYEDKDTALCYKLGAHGRTFRWDGFDWIKSSKVLTHLRFGKYKLSSTSDKRVVGTRR